MQIQKLITSKKLVASLIISFVLPLLGCLYANYWLLKAHYNLACKVNGQTVARLISKQTCGELEANKMDALELSRQNYLRDNAELFQ